jgi:ABC-type Fe3+ transport system substrate-binding protein
MREHLPKIVIIALLVAIVGLPILLRPADGGADAPVDAPRLVIYTPHNEQIRHEIEHAYNDHRRAQGLPDVVFDWRTPGGTSDIRKSILSQYNKLIDAGELETRGIGVDLFFGGGDYDHGKIASGVTVEEDGQETTYRIVMDPQIDAKLFSAAFPEEVIGGEDLVKRKTFTENGQDVEVVAWTGVTLSSFGIVYNNDSLKILGIDKPTTWSDLADPKLRGWVALADPGHSGSIGATFNTILKRQGWTEGWASLRMTYANARYFATDATRVPVDVARGDAAAGMCIDFYGRFQAGAVGKNRMGYADPIENGRSMTATTADPITLLRGAPDADLARAFIAWLLTPEAQSLWQRAKSDAEDSLTRPDKFELRRQPIRADLYTAGNKKSWVDKELDPFPTAVPFPEGTPDYFGMVAPVTKAMAIDIHEDLVLAWEALAEAREHNHPNRAEMEKAFFALPKELTLTWPDAELEQNWQAIHNDADHPRHSEVVAALADFEKQLEDIGDLDAKRVRWRAFFRDNYREVVRLGAE